jgi:hypothetical protein
MCVSLLTKVCCDTVLLLIVHLKAASADLMELMLRAE